MQKRRRQIKGNLKTLQITITPKEIQVRYDDPTGTHAFFVEDKGIRIQSDRPVAVYAHSENGDR